MQLTGMGHILVHLRRRELLCVQIERELILRCQQGALWITQQDDGGDFIIEAGQALALRRSGLAVVQVLRTAVGGLSTPAPNYWRLPSSNVARRTL